MLSLLNSTFDKNIRFVILILMNKKIKDAFIISFLGISMSTCFVFAQETPANSLNATTSSSSQLEITFPMQKEDFLLFYGVTKDQEVNVKIDTLRKDFMVKFQSLKDEYKNSMDDSLGDNTLTSPIPLTTKDSTKVTAQIKKTDSKTSTKKYTLKTDKAAAVDIIISPVVNTVDSSSGIHTENSSWFKKIKSIFNW